MGIDIVDILNINIAPLECHFHTNCSTSAVNGRGRDMKGVISATVADKLSQNFRIARLSVI